MRHGKNLLPLPRPGTPPAALVAIGLSVGMWGYAIAGVVLAVAGIFLLLVNAATPGETGRGFVKRLGVRNWTHSPSRQDGGQPRRSQGGAPGSVGRARVAARCRSVTIRKPRTLKLGLAGSGTNNIPLACLWGGRITAEVRPLHFFYVGKPYRAEPRMVGRVSVAEFHISYRVGSSGIAGKVSSLHSRGLGSSRNHG